MANRPRKPKVAREDFKLYDVVDAGGPYKGCKNNDLPLSLGEALKMRDDPGRKHSRRVKRTENREWEDFCYRHRYLYFNEPLGPVHLDGGEKLGRGGRTRKHRRE